MTEQTVRVVGIVRDIRNNNGENVIVLSSPRIPGQSVLREHINVRERDFAKDCKIVGNFSLNAEVAISCTLSKYAHGRENKYGLTKITKIQRL